MTLYRIVQEALTNTVRHAHAKHVGVIVEMRDGAVVAIVEDDGIGFDEAAAAPRDRLGLFGMQERARMSGGHLTVESAPGKGTTVFIEIPAQAVERFHEDPASEEMRRADLCAGAPAHR